MNTARPGIVVIGSSNTDMVVQTANFPKPGETILGGNFFMFSGGKGANQAVAAARIGAEVTFIGNIGNDIFGQRAISELQAESINTTYISTDQSKPSGIALILVDGKGENEIVVASGANNTLSDQHLLAAESAIAATDIILLQLEIPVNTVLFAAKLGVSHQKKIILNPAPAQEIPAALYSLLFLVTPNETEAELLTGIPVTDRLSAAKAASVLLHKGVQHVIITLGAKGAFFTDGNTELLIAAPVVKAVDSTAAGDVFNGALAVELSNGKDWAEAISFACCAAAYSVTRMGAQPSMPSRQELDKYFPV